MNHPSPISSIFRSVTRRQWLACGGALALLGSASLRAQSKALVSNLHIVIPANAGGGWDRTGRALGAALTASGAVGQVTYENLGGQGGLLGLQAFAQKHGSNPDALLIGGTVMVGAVALHRPATDLRHVQPLARLTSEYLTVVVAADSPLLNAKNLVEALRSRLADMPMAGGSAGGVDHLFAGMLVRAAKAPAEKLIYKPFTSGPEVVQAVLDKQAAIGISGYSEMSEALASGKLRAIGISSMRSQFGLPSFHDQGVDADMTNWRGVFTGKQVPAARVQTLTTALQRATQHESWQRALQENRWNPSWVDGKRFADFIALDLSTTRVMVDLLKLKAG
ncbi:MAG: tripartite tricarboxylate transporter substrate-binding protein [Comamonadaceae bacterium]|nr:tripartite tricarboxylate transporter substrate-binding protein [Comamonadaceae bacterium]